MVCTEIELLSKNKLEFMTVIFHALLGAGLLELIVVVWLFSQVVARSKENELLYTSILRYSIIIFGAVLGIANSVLGELTLIYCQ